MPPLSISAEAFARLWAVRRPGEDTEEHILRRLLGLPPPGRETAAPTDAPGGGAGGGAGGGFVDATYGVRFAEGFEIFRTYKGRAYRARAEGGRWRLDADGRAYDSLNQLSQAVIDGNENAWMFWFAAAPGGGRRRIAELRDPTLVQKRPRRKPPPAGPARQPSPAPAAAHVPETSAAPRGPTSRATPAVSAPDPETPPATPRGTGGLPWEPPTQD